MIKQKKSMTSYLIKLILSIKTIGKTKKTTTQLRLYNFITSIESINVHIFYHAHVKIPYCQALSF